VGRTEALPKSRYGVYLLRAREFGQQMERAVTEKAWNSVGLLGVHCVISACDALTTKLAGRRWSGQDHGGVHELVSSLHLPNASVALRQIGKIIAMKNQVEYESRAFTEMEAREVSQKVSRVLIWVTRQIET
jgi:hypothetical protein